MTEREALKLALEALEVANSCVDGYYIPKGKTQLPEVEEAIIAIKEALAQPEQEPVTWGVDWGRAGQTPCVSIIKRLNDGRIEVVAVEYGPQRTWVGLTDEEFQYCVELKNPESIAEEVEAKLKEKNT